jgi:serine/threonine protein kinase
MARVHNFLGAADQVNEWESIALKHLVATLPDSVILIPNITVMFPDQPEECDIIAVTPDAVFVIEVKGIAGDVVVSEQQMTVDGDVRSNPYATTRIKAQKLKSRLAQKLPWFGSTGWVEHVVVMAKNPRSFQVADLMKSRVVLLDSIAPLVSPNSPLLHANQIGRLEGKENEIIQGITGGAKATAKTSRIGQFRTKVKLFEIAQECLEVWRAENILTGINFVLEVHRQPEGLEKNQVQIWQDRVLQLSEIAQELGPSVDLDAPREVFKLDDGSVVIVWPDREPNLFSHFIQEAVTEHHPMTLDRANALCLGYATAMHHLHRQDWAMGKISGHNVVVRSNGRGAFVLEKPIKGDAGKIKDDLAFLGELIDRVNKKLSDPTLTELSKSLCHSDPEKRPVTASAIAVLEGVRGNQVDQAEVVDEFSQRFHIGETLKTHSYGKTVRAQDTLSQSNVILKYESGRPEGNWAQSEYRHLTSEKLLTVAGIVKAVAGGGAGVGFYLATESLIGNTLLTLIDDGQVNDPAVASKLIMQLLETLEAIHPDMAAIGAVIDANPGLLTAAEMNTIDELRRGGVAHNHLDPSNIVIVPGRGPVLIDCIRMARLGEQIPARVVQYWPKKMAITQSDPAADLFAVGSILLRMLTVESGGKVRQQGPSSAQRDSLVEIALQAIDEDAQKRFASATAFKDAIVSSGLVMTDVHFSEDVFSLQNQIEDLVSQSKFVEALSLCPENWTATRASIAQKQQLVGERGVELLQIDGVSLRYEGEVAIPSGSTGTNQRHDGGTAEVYIVRLPAGGVIEMHVCRAEPEGQEEIWTRVNQAFGVPASWGHVVRSKRMNVYSHTDQNQFMELSQVRMKPGGKFDNSATAIKVDEAGFALPLGGQDPHEIFNRFGALGFGTRELILNETNKRKLYLCVKFADDAQHVPAVAHFLSRIMPLHAGLVA